MEAEYNCIKENKEWEVQFMTLFLRDKEHERKGYDQGRAECRAEGEARARVAYATEKQSYLSEIGALRAELAKYQAAGIRV